MRTIAIVLGDNDFGNTFRPLLESVQRVLAYRDDLTPENVETIIRQGALSHYVAYQFRFSMGGYGGGDMETHFQSIRSYFKDLRVLFDEEAETDILTNDHDCGAWYLEIQSGVIAGY